MNDDLIRRQAVLDALHNSFTDGFNSDKWWNSTHVLWAINNAPSVNPQEPKTGHWKSFTHSAYHGVDDDNEPIWREVKVYHCSECNRRTVIKENYCPNCGSAMKGK